MNLEPDSPKHISPFYHGLLWGITITLTVVVSATIGATATWKFPSLFEAIENISKTYSE